jgi:hypothetical protein
MDEPELTPYEVEEQRLRDVARLILPLESKLRKLPKDHIEQLVIWLKNIHNPSDPEDRNADGWVPFYTRVAELKNVPEQIDLQNQAVRAARSAIYTGMLIGGLSILALWGIAAGWYVSLLLLVAVPYLWRKALRFWLKSALAAKEQEQKNLWRAIREAKNVPQLQNAGLYAYIDDKDIDNATQHMRDAIYCDGEDGYSFAQHMDELKAGFD